MSTTSIYSPADPFTTTTDDVIGPPKQPDKLPSAAKVINSTSPVLQTSAPEVSFARHDENVTVQVYPSV